MKTPRYLCLFIAVLTLCGCTITNSTRVVQNKFAFPNSDLTPLGAVSAEESHTSFLPPTLDKDVYDEMTQSALKQKGGDTLTDYVLTSSSTYPILPIIWFTTFKIDGTAVKVTQIGRQELH